MEPEYSKLQPSDAYDTLLGLYRIDALSQGLELAEPLWVLPALTRQIT